MKYSVGDPVKIVDDGWGCGVEHVGMCGVIESVPTHPYKGYALLMDDGFILYGMWEEGFELLRSHESSTASYLLKQMYEAVKYLPNKDWLDPSLERAVKEFLEGKEMSNKAKWAVGPLKGKYYGTTVCYENETIFKIWEPDHFAVPFASEREIAEGWTPEEDGHDHVEDQQSYRLAQHLVEYLNKTGFEIK